VIAGRNLCGSAFGGWKSRRDLPKLVSSSIDSLDKYITHERKFSDINRALQLLSEPSAQCLRCVIKMGE
jgi:Zn-dependent alcohol dehydrogenase